ncbi:MAG: class I SAM-dependent methyltransferase [Anaerolineae bacterium]|nr:class I SAM-dependent methyltransferase [Anaerolineae bacterium]
MTLAGLDSAFLEYIGYDPVVQKTHQRFYLPFFSGCQRVVDLGCGSGDFVELLVETGIDAVGVDADPDAIQVVLQRGLKAVNQDVFVYLDEIEPATIDGVFAGHLAEHLAYEKVFELIELAYRALKPGGVIVLATPDPRSLYAHLEMFYLHFGHITFYHPRLLCFFLEKVGFINASFANSESPVQSPAPIFGLEGIYPVRAKSLPVWKNTLFHRLLRAVRMSVAWLFLNPYLDMINSNFQYLYTSLHRVDYPFECYAKAIKPVHI